MRVCYITKHKYGLVGIVSRKKGFSKVCMCIIISDDKNAADFYLLFIRTQKIILGKIVLTLLLMTLMGGTCLLGVYQRGGQLFIGNRHMPQALFFTKNNC